MLPFSTVVRLHPGCTPCLMRCVSPCHPWTQDQVSTRPDGVLELQRPGGGGLVTRRGLRATYWLGECEGDRCMEVGLRINLCK